MHPGPSIAMQGELLLPISARIIGSSFRRYMQSRSYPSHCVRATVTYAQASVLE